MNLTRKQAIRSMAGLLATFWGAMREAYSQTAFQIQINDNAVFKLNWGDVKQPEPLIPEPCPSLPDSMFISTAPCVEKDGSIREGIHVGRQTEYIPGTASTEMDLSAFKSFTFKNGSESITITREEMWEALKS